MKTYYDFMSEITSDELYDRIVEHGMFSEKLPPVFSANSFLAYCKTKRTQSFSDVGYGYGTVCVFCLERLCQPYPCKNYIYDFFA